MTIQMIHSVYKEEQYIAQYGGLFSHGVSQNQLRNYTQINTVRNELRADSALQQFIKNENGIAYPLLPVFTPENTSLLAQELQVAAAATSERTRDCLQEISLIWRGRWREEAHSLLAHVVLANLWQSVWLSLVAPNTSGSIAIFDSVEDCSVIVTRVLPLSEMSVVAYWQNNLQEGNWILAKAFANRHMSRMLRSVDEQGLMLPSGGVEGQLLEMKLIRAVRLNGSQVPSYKITTPVINKEDIDSIRKHLYRLAVIGYEDLMGVKELLLKDRQWIFPNMKHIDEKLYLQSCYGIWSYALYREWLAQGLLPKLGRVPNLFEKITNKRK